jgi:Uma2 family endonuclease
MISILEQPETRELVVPISREFYHEAGAAGLLDQDVELLQGIIVKKMPKSPYHQWLVRYLSELLTPLMEAGSRFLSLESPVAIANSEPEPDLAVISGQYSDFKVNHPTTAEFVIEVAISTLEKDRLKAGIYASANVPEYWIVDAENKQLEAYTRPDIDRGEYRERRVLANDERAVSSSMPGFELDLQSLFGAEPTED